MRKVNAGMDAVSENFRRPVSGIGRWIAAGALFLPPSEAKAGETIHLSAQSDPSGVPAVSYRWNFDDGTSADGPESSHAYTSAGDFALRLTVEGVDGILAEKTFPVKVTGRLKVTPSLDDNRRFVEPTDH